jgi:hypothetical protein
MYMYSQLMPVRLSQSVAGTWASLLRPQHEQLVNFASLMSKFNAANQLRRDICRKRVNLPESCRHRMLSRIDLFIKLTPADATISAHFLFYTCHYSTCTLAIILHLQQSSNCYNFINYHILHTSQFYACRVNVFIKHVPADTTISVFFVTSRSSRS